MLKLVQKLFRRKPRFVGQPVRPPDPETEIVAVRRPDGRMDHSDTRNLDRMTFGLNEPTPELREAKARTVRMILRACDVRNGGEIAVLGCTGVFKHLQVRGIGDMNAFQAGQFLREGLAGSGVGLACFVPPTRYCLIHNTIGGLQPGQGQSWPELAVAVSRKLTAPEQAKVKLTQQALRKYAHGSEGDAAAMLSGFDRGAIEETLGGTIVEEEEGPFDVERLGAQTWRCEEHATFTDGCRYCQAAKIVHEGPLTMGGV